LRAATGRIFLEAFRDAPLFLVAGVKNHSVAQVERFAFLKRHRAGAARAADKIVYAERVGGEQPVVANMPIGWKAVAAWMIQDGDAHRFAIDGALIIDPRGAFGPRGAIFNAFAVDDSAALLGRRPKIVEHANRERALFRVAQL